MVNVTCSTFKIIQSYGGLKEAYFEVASASASDVIVFTDNDVEGIKFCALKDNTTGGDLTSLISSSSGTLLDQVVVGTGPSSKKLVGTILFRSY